MKKKTGLIIALFLLVGLFIIYKTSQKPQVNDDIRAEDPKESKDNSKLPKDDSKEKPDDKKAPADEVAPDDKEVPDDKNKPGVKPEPAPSIKGKYPAYYSGQAYNEVMEYVLFKVKNYDFEVDLKDAKKKLNLPDLKMSELLQYTSAALDNNPQYCIDGLGISAENPNNFNINVNGFTKDEIEKRRERIKKLTFELLDKYDFDGKTDYEKSVLINEIMIDYLDYDYGMAAIMEPEIFGDYDGVDKKASKERYDIALKEGDLYLALTEKKAVCTGYAKLYQNLASAVGLDSHFVEGMVKTSEGASVAHAWNWVKLDSKYYLVDVTWNDANPDKLEEKNNYKWLHLPVKFVEEKRGDNVFAEFLRKVDGFGSDFDQTYYAHNGMLASKEDLVPKFEKKIKELKSKKETKPEDWKFSMFNFQVNEDESGEIIDTINANLNLEEEGVSFVEGEFTYEHYIKGAKDRYPLFEIGQVNNPVMEYIVNKLRNYDYYVNIDEVRKELNMPDLSFEELLQTTSFTIAQNLHFGLLDVGLASTDDKGFNMNMYKVPKEKIEEIRSVIKKLTYEILEQHDFTGKDDYELSMMINRIVIDYLEYDYGMAYNIDPTTYKDHKKEATKKSMERLNRANEYGALYVALTEKKAVCQGYAELYQTLATAVGLDSLLVTGIVYPNTDNAETHAWNWVKLEGNYYLVDSTWNDTFDKDENDPYGQYKWMNIPLNYAAKIREDEIFGPIFKTIKNRGKDFKFTYFGKNGFYVEKDKIVETIERKVKELKARKNTKPKDWSFSVYNYDLTEKEIEKISEELMNKFNVQYEGVTHIDGEFNYMNYKEYYRDEDKNGS